MSNCGALKIKVLHTVDVVKYRFTLIRQCKNEPFEEALVRKTTTDRTGLRKGSYLPRLVSVRGKGRENRKALRKKYHNKHLAS